MDVSVIMQWVVTQGGLAGFAIWMLVKAYQDKEALYQQSKAESERYALSYREVILLMLIALDKSTMGYTLLVTKLDSLTSAFSISSQRQEDWFNDRRSAVITTASVPPGGT